MCIKSSRQLTYQPPNPKHQRQLTIILTTPKNSIENVTEQLKKTGQRCIVLESKNDDFEQCTRRQNLRISGIPENAGEITDDVVLELITKNMKVEVDLNGIDRSHCVERPCSKPTRDLIVRFTSEKSRQKIMKTVYEHNQRYCKQAQN